MKLSHIVILAIGLLPFALIACRSSTPQKVEAAAYQSELLLCVDKAATKDGSQACRAEVRAKFARLWADAGTDSGDASK